MRKSGKTTRKVDQAVQDFFNNGITYLYEGRVANKNVHQEAMNVFNSRMQSEHPHAKYTHEYGCFDGIWCFKIEKHNL